MGASSIPSSKQRGVVAGSPISEQENAIQGILVAIVVGPLMLLWFLYPLIKQTEHQKVEKERRERHLKYLEERRQAPDLRRDDGEFAPVVTRRTSAGNALRQDLLRRKTRPNVTQEQALGHFAKLITDYEWYAILSFLEPCDLAQFEHTSRTIQTREDISGNNIYCVLWKVAYVQPYHQRSITFCSLGKKPAIQSDPPLSSSSSSENDDMYPDSIDKVDLGDREGTRPSIETDPEVLHRRLLAEGPPTSIWKLWVKCRIQLFKGANARVEQLLETFCKKVVKDSETRDIVDAVPQVMSLHLYKAMLSCNAFQNGNAVLSNLLDANAKAFWETDFQSRASQEMFYSQQSQQLHGGDDDHEKEQRKIREEEIFRLLTKAMSVIGIMIRRPIIDTHNDQVGWESLLIIASVICGLRGGPPSLWVFVTQTRMGLERTTGHSRAWIVPEFFTMKWEEVVVKILSNIDYKYGDVWNRNVYGNNTRDDPRAYNRHVSAAKAPEKAWNMNADQNTPYLVTHIRYRATGDENDGVQILPDGRAVERGKHVIIRYLDSELLCFAVKKTGLSFLQSLSRRQKEEKQNGSAVDTRKVPTESENIGLHFLMGFGNQQLRKHNLDLHFENA